MQSFSELNLPPALRASLEAMNFTTPTPVQAAAVPFALQGRDILATAMTGSGKTGAFGIPMIARLLSNPRGTAMVMTPTRELAMQVEKVIKQMLGQYATIKSALLIGGESMPNQQAQLRARPRIIVGTPGRIIDHLQRGFLMLHDCTFLVLDEMDRMLDMGFEDQILQIMKYMPMQRQTLLFSATLPPQILKIAEKYQKTPERIEIGEVNKAAENIAQVEIHLTPEEKYPTLVNELKAREGTVIIFVRSKFGTEKLAAKLKKSGFTADAIHGDLDQKHRAKVLQAFRDKTHRILVATDIASRGLDIPHIEHVINFDLPQAPEDFIHRIGRTARAGADGAALSFITHEDGLKWRAIQKLINPNGAPQAKQPAPVPVASVKPSSSGEGSSDAKRRRRGGRNRNRSGGNGDAPQAARPIVHSAPSDAPASPAVPQAVAANDSIPLPGLPPAIAFTK